jgi:hypothetical protein
MLFRGDIPLTPEERVEYEIRREVDRMREEGQVLTTVNRSGETVWARTLRATRGRTPFRIVNPDNVRDA